MIHGADLQGNKLFHSPYPLQEAYSPENKRLDTQNDGLEKVTPFKNGNFWYLCQISGV